jgi:hypothetical protein
VTLCKTVKGDVPFAHTRPPNNLALTVTMTEPIVTREMTMENTWMDWLAGDCNVISIRESIGKSAQGSDGGGRVMDNGR